MGSVRFQFVINHPMRISLLAIIAVFGILGQLEGTLTRAAQSSFPGAVASLVGEVTATQKVHTVHTITISNRKPFYTPNQLHVLVGDTVTWKAAGVFDAHSVQSLDGHFASSDITQTQTWSVKFA